jgi:hypothetical protein
MKKFILASLFAYQFVIAAPFQASDQTPTLLAKAQQAYLEGDFSLAASTLKPAFIAAANDSVAQKNILQLFTKIQMQKAKAQIDTGWRLPKEIFNMRILTQRRSEDGNIGNQLILSGRMNAVDEITSLQLVRFPDTIVLDKSRSIGRFSDRIENDLPQYDYRSVSTPFNISTGLYLLKLQTKSGSNVDGWFMLDEFANSSAQPQILNLDGNPVFNTATPQIAWVDFTSPQFKKESEYRGLSIWVSSVKSDSGHWNFYTMNLNQNSALMGSEIPAENGWSRGPLEDGNYYALLSFSETQKFGPVALVRRSSTVKYFSVKK